MAGSDISSGVFGLENVGEKQGAWASTDYVALDAMEFEDRSVLGETKLSEV